MRTGLLLVAALWRATHPGPTLVVTALAVGLAIAAGLDAGRTVLLAAAVFAGQVSVGLSNDAIDAARDAAVGRADKPVASGVVGPGIAATVAVVAVIAALALSAPLGPGLVAAHAIALASAWAYNVRLKASVLSAIPFIVSFGLLPSFATLAAPAPVLAAPWAACAGATLGIAVHLTNVLPDLDDDRRTGIRGLPQRLGARAATAIAAVAVVLGALVVLAGPAGGSPSAVPPVAWVFFVAVAAVAVAALWRSVVRPPDRTAFRLVMLAALILAVQLIASGQALSA